MHCCFCHAECSSQDERRVLFYRNATRNEYTIMGCLGLLSRSFFGSMRTMLWFTEWKRMYMASNNVITRTFLQNYRMLSCLMSNLG